MSWIFKSFAKWGLLVVVAAAFRLVACAQEQGFDYGRDALGPRQWGCLNRNWTTCRTGSMQSPIAIRNRHSIDSCELGKLNLQFSKSTGTLISQPHLYKIELNSSDNENKLLFRGARYQLSQFHFHHPSEHTLNGHRFPLEMHLVYKSTSSLLVLAQMFSQGAPPSSVISQVLPLCGGVNLEKLKLGLEYFTYKGSLTTPPCTENVTWIVMLKARTASMEQIKGIKLHLQGQNARPIQKLNRRKVFAFMY